MEKYYVKAEWDAVASVWYVADTNVPGLRTEANTVDELFSKLNIMVPELLSLNASDHPLTPFDLIAHRSSNANCCH